LQAVAIQDWLRVALAGVSEGVLAADASGQVGFLNSAAQSLTGWPPEEAAGQPLAVVVPTLDPDTRAPVAATEVGPWRRLVLQTRGGAERSVEVSAGAAPDGGVVVTLRESREPQEGEAGRLRAEALVESNRRKDQFLAMLAHELRNPLTPLRNGLHILKMPEADTAMCERARAMMERQVRNLTRMIDDLLEVSRLTRGKIALRKSRLDLGRVAREAAEDHRPAFEKGGVGLEVRTPETPTWVEGDATRLAQILDNLLSNALKFTDRGGAVTVSVAGGPEEASLSVRDTGQGIPAELLPRLFDVFAQAEQTLERGQGGLGLGLTLVKGLAGLHGGAVEAHSAGPGRGADFIVRLPARPEPAALSRQPEAPPPAPRRLRILVVEDNRDAAESLRILLSLQGHEVKVADSGPAGVRAAADLRPDVVLCDIGLPGMDGYTVAGELRRNPETAGARMIAVTGYGAEDDRRRSREAGFDLHLTKPVDPDTLGELIALKEPG
jgi:signal transduction histidine kinase/CheY-like chemotaxis protein